MARLSVLERTARDDDRLHDYFSAPTDPGASSSQAQYTERQRMASVYRKGQRRVLQGCVHSVAGEYERRTRQWWWKGAGADECQTTGDPHTPGTWRLFARRPAAHAVSAQTFAQYTAWLQSRGGVYAVEEVPVGDGKGGSGGGVRGVEYRTTAAVAKGTPLMRFPRALLMSSQTAAADASFAPLLELVQGLDDESVVLLYLMHDLSRSSDTAAWGPFWRCLQEQGYLASPHPTQPRALRTPATPAFWPMAALNKLSQSSELGAAIVGRTQERMDYWS
jgi:hypothetical protein